MAERVIYLMRHGKTVWNQEHRIQGRKDSALLPESLITAEKIAKYLSMQNIDSIFSSPLGRAKRTAEFVCDRIGTLYETNPLLMECDHGRCEGMTLDEIRVSLPGFYADREKNKWETPWPDGEAYLDVSNRAQRFIDENLALPLSYLIIAHEMINKCLAGALLEWENDCIMTFRQKNTELLLVKHETLRIVDFD